MDRRRRRAADIAQMQQSARKGARRALLSAGALREPHPRRPIHLSRARGPAGAEHGRRPQPAARPGLAERWRVDERRASAAVLSFRHPAGEWPWDYEARQEFALDEARAVGSGSPAATRRPSRCRAGSASIPISRADRTRASTRRSTHAWTIDEHVLPVEQGAADGPLRPPRPAGLRPGSRPWLRRLGREARMTDPDWPYDAAAVVARRALLPALFAAEGGIFVAEPVTHANAALNAPEEQWSELGMRVLEPGEEMSLDMRLEVIPK